MFLRCLAIAALGVGVAAQAPDAPSPDAQEPAAATTQRFRNHNQTFELDLPVGWRLLTPNEASQLGDSPATPMLLHQSLPRTNFAVGPVEQWFAGDFSAPWLYAVEFDEAWYIDEDYADNITARWREESERGDTRYEVEEIRRQRLGTQQVECVTAVRLSTPPAPRPALRSLDVYAPTANQKVVLSFACPPDVFERWQPEFRRWLATLTFARVAKEQESLSDRLWTPILTGGLVGIVLIVLYRHTRGRRQSAR
ncbi:MAG: hypothetical protein H6835_04900 [Planctomycetes bacterium]|nr:hypothetical protein [Planctomycetota bacterium]